MKARRFLGSSNFNSLTLNQLTVAVVTGSISVIWFELVRIYKRRNPYTQEQ